MHAHSAQQNYNQLPEVQLTSCPNIITGAVKGLKRVLGAAGTPPRARIPADLFLFPSPSALGGKAGS